MQNLKLSRHKSDIQKMSDADKISITIITIIKPYHPIQLYQFSCYQQSDISIYRTKTRKKCKEKFLFKIFLNIFIMLLDGFGVMHHAFGVGEVEPIRCIFVGVDHGFNG